MGEWRETTLGQLLADSGGSIKTGPFGTVLSASEYTAHGAPVISVGEIRPGRFEISDRTPHVGPEVLERLPAYLLERGDIVFARKGSVDRSAWVGEAESGWFLGSDGLRLRCGAAVDSRFLAFQFQAQEVRRWLLQHASGSTLLSLNQTTLERVPLKVPDLLEQQAIAEVLGALDDKIAANDRLVRCADSLASASYGSLLSEGAEAPLTQFAEFVNGKAFTKGASGTGRVVIRIAELNSGIGGSTVYSDAKVDDRHLARPGDILFAWSGSLTLHRWFRPEGIVNQHIFKVIPKSAVPKWLVWHAVADRLEYFKAVAADKATTMGHIQRRHLDEMVTVPAPEKVVSHDGFMTAIWDRALAAEQESLRLVATRDALLPGLMSGALQVKDAERLAQDLAEPNDHR